MGGAADLARVFAAGRPRLPDELRRMLTAEAGWVLALLLWGWARDKGRTPSAADDSPIVDIGAYRDVAGAFDFFSGPLLRLVGAVTSAPLDAADTSRAAGLGAQFATVAEGIGAGTLVGLLNSPRYRAISETIVGRYPVPPDVREAFGESAPTVEVRNSRVRDYTRFDFPDRRTDEHSPAYLRRQLDDTRLSPELRMYYEQQLTFQGLSPYRSDDEARRVWATLLDGPMSPEVRDYYSANLDALNESDRVFAESDREV